MNINVLTVIELARLTKVEPHVIRYYTKIGILAPDKNQDNGYKLYKMNDANKVNFTRKAKSLGYSLKEIKLILSHTIQGDSPCPLVREIIYQRLNETKIKIKELQALQKRMKKAIKLWEDIPNQMPNGATICHLIEGFIEE